MLKHFFVTGTDTEVGKTIACQALLQALQKQGSSAIGYKPIAFGSEKTEEGLRNHDALILQAVSSIQLPYSEINPITLEEEIVNAYRGAPLNYELLSAGLVELEKKADWVIIEGTGGWRVLMGELRPFSEWVAQQQLPVLLVVGIKLGCINHAILTAQTILNDGLPLAGWIANRINPGLAHYAETLATLKQVLPAPQVGEIPYLPKIERRDLSGYIDLSALSSIA